MTHAVYYRNAHGHEILMKPDNLTWRTLGGNIGMWRHFIWLKIALTVVVLLYRSVLLCWTDN